MVLVLMKLLMRVVVLLGAVWPEMIWRAGRA
jgi:hypothetical protein